MLPTIEKKSCRLPDSSKKVSKAYWSNSGVSRVEEVGLRRNVFRNLNQCLEETIGARSPILT